LNSVFMVSWVVLVWSIKHFGTLKSQVSLGFFFSFFLLVLHLVQALVDLDICFNGNL
jgi:hypothetical protein